MLLFTSHFAHVCLAVASVACRCAAGVCVELTSLCLPLSYSRHGHGSICYLEPQWRRLRNGPQGPLIIPVGGGWGSHCPSAATLPHCHHGASGPSAAHPAHLCPHYCSCSPTPHQYPSPSFTLTPSLPYAASSGVFFRLHWGSPWT